MNAREEIARLTEAINQDTHGVALHLVEEDFEQLERILGTHPDLWPAELADTLQLLRRKLQWETIDRKLIPSALQDFFDRKFKRDMDPMGLARQIAHEMSPSCEDCGCRC